jgi:polysaccharide biosynthesis transport protein
LAYRTGGLLSVRIADLFGPRQDASVSSFGSGPGPGVRGATVSTSNSGTYFAVDQGGPAQSGPVQNGPVQNGPVQNGTSLISHLLRNLVPLGLLTLLGLGLGLAYLALAKPSYTATSALFIDPRSRKVVADEVVSGAIGTDASLFESQLAIIRSDTILRRVIIAENLLADPDFVSTSKTPGLGARLRERLMGPLPKTDDMTEALSSLARALRVRRELNTYIVSVDATSANPVKAAKLANAVVQAYLDDQSTAKSDGASRVNVLIDSRLDELKQQVRRAETRMDEFKRTNKIVTSEGGLLNEQQLTKLNTELVSVRAQLATAKARFDELSNTLKRGVSPETLPEAMASGVVQKLRDQYAATARREASLSAQLQPRHPVMIDIRAQLNSVRQQIVAELQRISAQTQSEYQIAAGREREIATALKTSEAEVAKTNTAQIELRAFEREADASREILRAFLARAKETQEQQNLSIAEARVITPAVVPSRPTSPNPPLILLISALGGLGLGVANTALRMAQSIPLSQDAPSPPAAPTSAAFARVPRTTEQDNATQGQKSSPAPQSVSVSVSQSKSALNTGIRPEIMTSLGSILELPLRPITGRRERAFRRGLDDAPAITVSDVLEAVADDNIGYQSPFNTSVSQTLEQLMPSGGSSRDTSVGSKKVGDNPFTIALMVSTAAGAGVTTAATALAYMAARRGIKTLLVDAASDNPTLSNLFALDRERTEPCILDSKPHLEAILEVDSRSGLALLPIALADLRTFTPDQIQRFGNGLGQLAADYHFVIIDGGALDTSPASALFAGLASQVIVVSSNPTLDPMAPRALERLGISFSQARSLRTRALQ